MKYFLTTTCIFYSLVLAHAQTIPADKIIEPDDLGKYLKKEVKEELTVKGKLSEGELAIYLRNNFSERFFYDWKTVDGRFDFYRKTYNNQNHHKERAEDHMAKFADSTTWILPFNYLNGQPVNAYALRHLARQHKMLDIAHLYFYDGKDPKYIRYFVRQMRSLNAALENGAYEKIEDGNGVYEVFRSGYRILNWLAIHNMFLGEEAYTDNDQLLTIATLLQHGAHLYARNEKFSPGNHQTRGMSALAMLAIIFRDFEGTDLWYDRAMKRLEEHLSREINNDGFQFERSVHYHMSDIANYFYVYQLATISDIDIKPVWTNKLKSLFTTLARIAYPDKSAPVLQDDTEIPWAEKNDISGAMTLGYLLFEDETFGYFANTFVEDRMYWFLQQRQLDLLVSIEGKRPGYGSDAFTETGYYIMREGWNENDKMMIVSAGLDDEKPDHQHGDMLGIQAMANGTAILPNYQVRYSLPDYGFFKNSMVKNVALVDDELQGKEYRSNKGGSGFGKFGQLPQPTVLAWVNNDQFDLFVGSHNGFENIGVQYTRQVIFVKDEFWLVKDNFYAEGEHAYKQVWQGHYTFENGPDMLRATFHNGGGCDILQLHDTDAFETSGSRGKEWAVVSKSQTGDFSFLTMIYPYAEYDKRLDESDSTQRLPDWTIGDPLFEASGPNVKTLNTKGQSYAFDVQKLILEGIEVRCSTASDMYLKLDNDKVILKGIGDKEVNVSISGAKEVILNGKGMGSSFQMLPGDVLELTK